MARALCFKCGKARDGAHKSYCKSCNAEYARQNRAINAERHAIRMADWRRKNKHRTKVYRRRALLKSAYGISIEQYEEMLEAQNGCCAICERQASANRYGTLYVDHDHKSGSPRMLLCSRCNFAVGQLGDDVEVARRLVAYLERFSLASHVGGKG